MRESTRKIARTRVQITSKSSEHKWYTVGGVYEVYSYPRDRTKYKVPNTSLLIDKADCKRIKRVHPEITLQELTDLQTNEEIVNLRRQVIDLTAELDRAKREINILEYLRKEDNNLINAQWKNIEELKDERDIAGRGTVEIAFKLADAKTDYEKLKFECDYHTEHITELCEQIERDNAAWQEKVDSLELELGTKHIYNWYLKPIFMFCAGATTAIVAVTWWVRWYL